MSVIQIPQKTKFSQQPNLQMLRPFVCGSGNFHHEEDDHRLPSSLRTSRRSISCRRSHRRNKNPYSMRGLDKFATLLADLEERRQKIYEEIGSQDTSLVRFGYSNSKGWVPIVVKLKDLKQDKNKIDDSKDKPVVQNNSEDNLDKPLIEQAPVLVSGSDGKLKKNKKKTSFISSFNLFNWRRPYNYLPMVIILILLCLVMYGRSFAILCTSIWWYLVPLMKPNGSNPRRSMKKNKEYVRRLSEKKMDQIDGSSSPEGEMMIRHGVSPRRHGTNNSW